MAKPVKATAPKSSAKPAKQEAKKATKPASAKPKTSPRVAVVAINNMQYVVKEGESINTRIALDSKDKDLDVKLLALIDGENFTYGTPHLSNKLDFELGEVVLGEKVTAFRYKSKARHRRKVGFRQKFVKFKLNSVK